MPRTGYSQRSSCEPFTATTGSSRKGTNSVNRTWWEWVGGCALFLGGGGGGAKVGSRGPASPKSPKVEEHGLLSANFYLKWGSKGPLAHFT